MESVLKSLNNPVINSINTAICDSSVVVRDDG